MVVIAPPRMLFRPSLSPFLRNAQITISDLQHEHLKAGLGLGLGFIGRIVTLKMS